MRLIGWVNRVEGYQERLRCLAWKRESFEGSLQKADSTYGRAIKKTEPGSFRVVEKDVINLHKLKQGNGQLDRRENIVLKRMSKLTMLRKEVFRFPSLGDVWEPTGSSIEQSFVISELDLLYARGWKKRYPEFFSKLSSLSTELFYNSIIAKDSLTKYYSCWT